MKKIVNTITITTILLTVLCIPNVKATPVYFSGTGSYYEAIAFPKGITWDDANIYARNRSYSGYQGHLATITSVEENEFILDNLGGAEQLNGYWLGGFQPIGSQEPNDNWQWITGEEWSFANWHTGEPNNTYGGNSMTPYSGIVFPDKRGTNEEALQFWGFDGTWNDMERSVYWGGAVVEYTTPEPGTLLLLGFGLLGLAGFRRKLKKKS